MWQEVASQEVKRTLLKTTFTRRGEGVSDLVDGREVGLEHIFHHQVTLLILSSCQYRKVQLNSSSIGSSVSYLLKN